MRFRRVIVLASLGLSWSAMASAAPDESPAAVLGLDTRMVGEGERLTGALRKAFTRRGLSGPTADLVELRLGLGCHGDEPACLARGGEVLGARRLIYGHLRATDEGYRLELAMLEVESASVARTLDVPLARDDLSAENVSATAERIVDQMVPEESAPAEISAARVTPTPVASAPPPPPPPEQVSPSAHPSSGLVWGSYRPRPAWKWVGFGISVASTVAFAGATAGIAARLRGPMVEELHEAADASLTDGNSTNDIDRTMVANICEAARATPPGFDSTDEGGRPIVTNESVTRVCNQADSLRLAGQVTLGFTIVSAVSTAVFTTLLFVHRPDAGKRARRARRARWALNPRFGGATLTVAGSF